MRISRLPIRATAGIVLALVTLPVLAESRDLGREVLAPSDGWASFSTGTTGGAAATPDHVYVVHHRRELIAALNNGV